MFVFMLGITITSLSIENEVIVIGITLYLLVSKNVTNSKFGIYDDIMLITLH
jgi:hypothetical protein